MKKVLMLALAVLISVAFVTTVFAQKQDTAVKAEKSVDQMKAPKAGKGSPAATEDTAVKAEKKAAAKKKAPKAPKGNPAATQDTAVKATEKPAPQK